MYKQKPLISVLMPVYNAGEFLTQSLDSILQQTYRNIEIIIVDDASTDATASILKTYKKQHKNIRVLRNKRNLGISASTEKAISHARGSFLARMDADDISLPNRFEKQISYLQTHTDVVALGTQCMLIDRDNNLIGEKQFPTSAQDVYQYIYHFIPVQHPTLMIARDRLPEHFSFYDLSEETAEDVKLLFKLFRYGKVENLPDYLFAYRLHENNNSLKQVKKTFYLTLKSRIQAVTHYGYKPTFRGVLITLIQAIIVTLLPEKLLTKTYLFMKGMRTVPSTVLRSFPRFAHVPFAFLSILIHLRAA